MRMRFWPLLTETVPLLGVVVVSFWVFSSAATTTRFHLDESGALWQSRYFSYLFLERDLTKPEWGDNFVTHTQPMLTRYILGGWLWAHGYDLFKMPRPYVWDKSLEDNRVTGRVPGEALLRQAR